VDYKARDLGIPNEWIIRPEMRAYEAPREG